jgi:hypothetical protein
MAAHPTELSYRHDMKLVISDDFVARCFRAAERASLAVIGYMSAQSNKPLQPPSSGKSGVD